MSEIAAQYWAWLEREMVDSDIILCHRPLGKHPKYFCGFHPNRRTPVYSYDAGLARRFAVNEPQLVHAYVEHLKNAHGHEVFVTKRPKVSPHAAKIPQEKTKHA